MLEVLCSSGLHVAPGSGFCLFPVSISAIPAPSFLLQSPSPSPPALPSPLSLLQTLLTIPAMSPPGGILPGSDPGALLSLLLPDLLLPALRVPAPAAGSSTATFPARPADPWDLPLMSPRKGTGFRPWGRGHWGCDKGDKDTNPRAGRSPAQASRWNEGGNRDRTRGLLSPCCDRRSCRVPVSSCGRIC